VKVLITGIAGFIGSRLAEAMLDHGHTVTGIDDLSTGRAPNVPVGAELVTGDIRNPRDIPYGQWDVIYHAAASYTSCGGCVRLRTALTNSYIVM
jgi:UDP-glucose 4-epimerase